MRFGHVVPSTLEEASQYLQEHEASCAIAGGTDLLVAFRNRAVVFEEIVDLMGLRGLDGITLNGERLRVGALVTLKSVEKFPLINTKYCVLSEAARNLGSWQIRNVATVGGNLCNASPSADLAPPLLVLNARACLFSVIGGYREISLEKFFLGPGVSALAKGEILTEISIPEPPEESRGIYLKHTIRRSVDISVVSVALIVAVDNGVFRDVKIALGAVAPTPMRAYTTEQFLTGKDACIESIAQAATIAAEECNPITDVRSSADYRKEMVSVLVKRGLEKLALRGW